MGEPDREQTHREKALAGCAGRRDRALTVPVMLVLSACGAKQDVISTSHTKPFNVMLDFFPNADHAALYSAIAQGDFRAVGLDVRPQVPAEPADPLKLLAAGKVDMAISYEPELLLARDQGLKLVSIAALVQRPLTSIIALPGKHVTSVASLKGKRVGTAGIAYQAAELRTALLGAGVNPSSVKEANVGFNLVPAMLSGKVAATLGGFWNYEAIQLRLLHKHPIVIPVDQAGVPSYDELVLVVREDEARSRGQDLRAFLQALTPGRAPGAGQPVGGRLARREGEPVARTASSSWLRSNRRCRRRCRPITPSRSATRTRGVGVIRQLDVRPPAAQHYPNAGLPPFTNEFLPGQGI